MKTTTQLPLDQLAEPDNDVRTGRPDAQVRSIANSMGNPDVGQLQPVLAFPVGWEDLEIDGADDLDQLVRDGHRFEILDGYTRYLAARDHLKWDRIWTWIHDRPPQNVQMARLDANTERITMSEYETVRAVCESKEDRGLTWQEIAEEVGWDASYLSQCNSAMNGPDWLVEAWMDPDVPVSTSHILDLRKAMGPKFVGELAEYGDLEEADAEKKAERMAQNLLQWCLDYGWGVTELRKQISEKQGEVLDELVSKTGHRDAQREAESKKALNMDGVPRGQEEEDLSCVICGGEWTTRIAIPVCDEDRGMLADHTGKGKSLMAPAEVQETPQQAEIDALADQLGMDPEEIHRRLEAD